MRFRANYRGFIFIPILAFAMVTPYCGAQNRGSQPAGAPPTTLDRLNAIVSGGKSVWTADQLATMEHLRDAALRDPYALDELRHLTDNIGPRLSGSPQAQQAVNYVAGEMRSLGADVTLEKASVPHWVRGVETAELIAWPGQTPGSRRKWF